MELKKNDEIVVEIDDLGNEGEGIGHVEGYTLFIRGALPGEKVLAHLMKLNKNYGFAKMVEILEPSKERVTPACSNADKCGGCNLFHLSYEGQLAYKEKKVKDCLSRLGKIDMEKVEFMPIIGMDRTEENDIFYYRNKAQFPIRRDENGKNIAGFFVDRSHRIVPVQDCKIEHKDINKILKIFLEYLNQTNLPAYDEKNHSGLIRHLYVRRGYFTGEIMVCVVINGNTFPKQDKFTSFLLAHQDELEGEISSICINVNKEKTNVILGKKTYFIYGKKYIEDYIGDLKYRISPHSFYQVNPKQTLKLYKTAIDFADLKGDENVWDLYCGIGTISLIAASKLNKGGKVFGVEIVAEAIENAKLNGKINGIENAYFECGKAEDVASKMAELGTDPVDVIIVDPPRKGCDQSLLDTIEKMNPKKVVYVSCNPATLARDLKILGGKGYEVRKVQPCDMFGFVSHVETVVQLVNIGVKPDYTVRLEVDVDEFYKTVGEDKRDYLDSEEYKKIKAKNKDK